MLGWLGKNRCGPIGLDIGAEGARLLQLARCGDRVRVQAAARWHFPPGALADGADPATRRRLVGEALRDLLKNGAFRGRGVVSCLPAGELAVKNIRLPHMPDGELANAVQWECKERFGFQVSPDRVHYINAGEVRQGTEVRDEIVLMAVTEETVAQHLEMLEAIGVRPVHIDTEPTALFRTYERFLRRAEDESAVSVVVDLGYASTKVVVARGRTIMLLKTIDLGGMKFDEAVARQLGLDRAEAAHLRKQADGEVKTPPPEGAAEEKPGGDQVRWSIHDAIREPAQALGREISLCLRYCAVTFRGLRPTKITLAGGEAYDPTLVKLLGENLECPCVLGEPLRGVELGGANLGGDRRGELMEWSVATGLAFRDLTEDAAPDKANHEPSRVSA